MKEVASSSTSFEFIVDNSCPGKVRILLDSRFFSGVIDLVESLLQFLDSTYLD